MMGVGGEVTLRYRAETSIKFILGSGPGLFAWERLEMEIFLESFSFGVDPRK